MAASPYSQAEAEYGVAAITRRIRKRPLTSMTIACGAGFFVGGGLHTWIGRTMLIYSIRLAMPELIREALSEGNGDGRRERRAGAASGSG